MKLKKKFLFCEIFSVIQTKYKKFEKSTLLDLNQNLGAHNRNGFKKRIANTDEFSFSKCI